MLIYLIIINKYSFILLHYYININMKKNKTYTIYLAIFILFASFGYNYYHFSNNENNENNENKEKN